MSWNAATKQPCLYPLPDGRRCCECDTCQGHDRLAATTLQLADVISAELDGISLQHSVAHKWSAGAEMRFIEGIARFGSVRAFAAALERAGADAEWSAGLGWTFREVDPDA